MATTPGQKLAKDQLRHLRHIKDNLQEEKRELQGAAARILEINAEIDAINAQIDLIKVRDPDEPTVMKVNK
jgi:hypothetical protein